MLELWIYLVYGTVAYSLITAAVAIRYLLKRKLQKVSAPHWVDDAPIDAPIDAGHNWLDRR